ncbi:MAG TPA: helix-turn-helix transcriptional regulator [Solirubrobacterales bacterium]|nr:helix-turn-helix transcriptional regulator [Solirubrobacterales bacterium]
MDHPIVARFGRNLKQARARAGLTQEEVNWRSGVHPTELSKMEHGTRDVHISSVARLAAALGVSPGELLDGLADESSS